MKPTLPDKGAAAGAGEAAITREARTGAMDVAPTKSSDSGQINTALSGDHGSRREQASMAIAGAFDMCPPLRGDSNVFVASAACISLGSEGNSNLSVDIWELPVSPQRAA